MFSQDAIQHSPARHALAFLAFVIPTLMVGFGWKYGLFREEYGALQMHRADISMVLAFGSLFIQAAFWAFVCSRLTAQGLWRRAAHLFLLACPLGWSFAVCMVGAKHVMTSVPDFVMLESAFTVVMYLVVCPLISASYARRPPALSNDSTVQAGHNRQL
ncbi:MAG: hypothetical protein KUG77_14370 [Nannocystaceae bacterium]|nr:hypothetical protein [Nannocystaceae bacterium]